VPGRRREKRTQAPYPRTARVNEVLREVVADAIERLADVDDRLRLITVTEVDTTPDLSRATVYLSSLPDPARDALGGQRAHLQAMIAREVRLKRTPHLVFEPDPSVTQGDRVDEILRHIRHERAEPADPAAPSTPPSTSGDDQSGG
jgi:ribosome-binding factor A